MTRKSIGFMSVKTQFDNLGDALINRELARLIAVRIPLSIDLSRSPESFHATMGVEGIANTRLVHGPRGRMMLAMAAAALSGQRCYFFLNPGGLGGGVGGSSRAFISSIVYNLILFGLKMVGVKVCLAGVSFEPMTRRELLVTRFRRAICHSFSVRDKESARYLASEGIRVDGIAPDLSFNLYDEPAQMIGPRDIATAYSFRADRGLDMERLSAMAMDLIDASPAGSIHAVVSQVGRDNAAMFSLYEKLSASYGPDRIIFVDCHQSMDDASAIYSRVESLYSNRLHALLVAAHAGSVPVALIPQGKQRKISALFTDLGLSGNIIDFNAPTPSGCAPMHRDTAYQQCEQLNAFFDQLLSAR